MSKKGEERRQQLIHAALRVFALNGFKSAPIAAIADEAGLTLPGLLHYFPSKVHLLIAVLEHRDAEMGEILGDTPRNWRNRIDQLKEINRRNSVNRGVIQAFTLLNAESLAEGHPAHEWFKQRTVAVRGYFADSFREGISSGELRGDFDPDAIAIQLMAVMDGLQIQWLRTPEKVDLVTSFETYLAGLIGSLEVARPAGAGSSALA